MDLLSQTLPANWNLMVPFVTYGGVTSGVALYEMAESFCKRGGKIAGAAKVLASHSSMWRSTHPLGAGHPDSADDEMVRQLVNRVVEKIATADLKSLTLDMLDYQPPRVKAMAADMNIAKVKTMRPAKRVYQESCTLCGLCAQVCPMEAIILDPYPRFGEECFLCNRCIRMCPGEAIPYDAGGVETRLRDMAAGVQESPESQMFA
jgi:NAD-dependent dihydropyrimidine dehydrogenase PreA subunit